MQAHGGTNPHRIVAHGKNRMVLSCSRTGQGVIEATRQDGENTWTLTAHGTDHDDRIIDTETTRRKAVDAMICFADDLLPHDSWEVHIPYRHIGDHEKALLPVIDHRTDDDGNLIPIVHLWDEL